jgi:hypothetical protein
MLYIKKWKTFESKKLRESVDTDTIYDIFLELLDDGTISKLEFVDIGYIFSFYPCNTSVKAGLLDSMYNYPDSWEKRPCKFIQNQPWKDIFKSVDSKYFDPEWLSKEGSGYSPMFHDILVKNIELGKIPAYPFILFSLGKFAPENLPQVIEVLERVYRATGLRPFREFWQEDFIEPVIFGTGEVESCIKAEVYLTNIEGENYKNLVEQFNPNEITKQIVENFL